MAGFSIVTLTGDYGSSAAGGTLNFTLSQPISNNNVILPCIPVVVTLDGAGTFSQTFQSNVDAATVPQGSQWGVTEEITGSSVRDYSIQIPPIVTETDGQTFTGADANVVLLTTATASLNMVGQSITGTNIPANTTIIDVQVGNPTGDPFDTSTTYPLNSVVLSNNATGAGTGLTLTIGTTIDISQLMPGSPIWA